MAIIMMKRKTAMLLTLVILLMGLVGCSANQSQTTTDNQEKTNLYFYYPTQVGGDLANGMERIVKEFNETHPDIAVTAVYSGSYKLVLEAPDKSQM